MKCDGPSQIPCRGCRQANVKCVFEPRSRPKSISALPTRPPPFHPAPYRPMSPAGGGPPSFYPSGPSIAPPITSRPPPLGPNEPYALRQAREPVPPQPITSIAAAVSNPFPPRSPTTSTGAVAQPQPPPPAAAYYPPTSTSRCRSSSPSVRCGPTAYPEPGLSPARDGVVDTSAAERACANLRLAVIHHVPPAGPGGPPPQPATTVPRARGPAGGFRTDLGVVSLQGVASHPVVGRSPRDAGSPRPRRQLPWKADAHGEVRDLASGMRRGGFGCLRRDRKAYG